MKRLALVLGLFLAASSAFALDTTRHGNRIGILGCAERWENREDVYMSSAVRNFLQAELHKAGFDAFDAHATYDALRRDEADAPDYWIEIASSSGGGPVGGVGVGGSHVVVDISVVVARVAAEVRVYDGRSLELVQRFELDRTKTGVMPTSIGVGGRDLFGWIALPIMHYAQYRAAAREVARDAALRVAQWRRD